MKLTGALSAPLQAEMSSGVGLTQLVIDQIICMGLRGVLGRSLHQNASFKI